MDTQNKIQREIKFRAWNKTEKRMMAWEELCDEDKNGSGDGEKLADYFNNSFSNIEQLMQFTGLKDKNGKEVYEGDIVKHRPTFPELNKKEHIGEIIIESSRGVCVGNIPICFESEVIGNVFENPKLLNPSNIQILQMK